MEIECISKAPCPTGSFKFTGAYNLPCKEVAHAVGPIWQVGINQEAENLANCYEEVIKAVYEKGYCSVAFPFISSNIFGYPREECARVALTSIRKMIEIYPVKVIMCAYSDEDYKLFQDVRDELDKLTINTDKMAGSTEKMGVHMYTEQEFRERVSRKIAGWYSDEAFREKAVERIIRQRETIIDLLALTHRQGIAEVIDYLDKSGFFYRASSSYKHHNFPGGLAEHSLGTY